ncbi:MAG: mannose-6-phosphate isomerase, class I [Treponema sp.]|jgi:mannose-6-phosphate isomerase|nr:mannose-6-phosphate isomerase, class I [Treponema sp.]
MPKNSLRIEVLGASIPISAEEEKDYLDRLLADYKKAIEDTQKATGLEDPLKIAILTGFLLYDEAEKLRAALTERPLTQEPDGNDEAESLTMSLISRLDAVLKEPPAGGHTGTGERTGTGGHTGAGHLTHSLKNPIKHYDWGSPEWIPSLLGETNPTGEPWAEMWMGVHPEGPSLIEDTDGRGGLPLSAFIGRSPLYCLGKETLDTFGGLPFLFKTLAAAKPLSIQAHPNQDQARDGFERENAAGIDIKAANRNYKDPNHKPEIICALTPFTAMCGFRTPDEIRRLLEDFSAYAPSSLKAGLASLSGALFAMDGENPLKSFLEAVFGMNEKTRQDLTEYVHAFQIEKHNPLFQGEYRLVSQFARLYPGDPAIISPLYLNVLRLKPGEAMFLPSGALHAYVYGFGIELMANSDNVLRGGLTRKNVDIKELCRILKFSPFKPLTIKAGEKPLSRYNSPAREFSLSYLEGELLYKEPGPSIVLVGSGELLVSDGDGKDIHYKKGSSLFVPAEAGRNGIWFKGNFSGYAASSGLFRDI